jgi:5-methyltetrahydrofolate--homocysteine methyltransferase
MKRAVAQLETYLEKSADVTKGRVVLATVYGDVHDIGKNLVKTILTTTATPCTTSASRCRCRRSSTRRARSAPRRSAVGAARVDQPQMPICVAELDRAGLDIPVLLGGAAINRNFGRRAALLEGGAPYEPGVFYCKDAFEGLDVVNALVDPAQRPRWSRRRAARPSSSRHSLPSTKPAPPRAAAAQKDFRVTVSRDVDVPAPPQWGARITPTKAISFAGMFEGMDLKTLYRLHWGARGSGEAVRQADPRRLRAAPPEAAARSGGERLAAAGRRVRLVPRTERGPRSGRVRPGGVHGRLARAARQARGDRALQLPAPDRARGIVPCRLLPPAESSKFDVLALQVVSVGAQVDEYQQALDQRGAYSEALFVHGLGVAAAEGLAEWHHNKIRAEWGLAADRGKRYSFGYSACPDLADQAKLFKLLKPEDSIGVHLTSAFQLVPEASTSALIVHHPQAGYFMVKE